MDYKVYRSKLRRQIPAHMLTAQISVAAAPKRERVKNAVPWEIPHPLAPQGIRAIASHPLEQPCIGTEDGLRRSALPQVVADRTLPARFASITSYAARLNDDECHRPTIPLTSCNSGRPLWSPTRVVPPGSRRRPTAFPSRMAWSRRGVRARERSFKERSINSASIVSYCQSTTNSNSGGVLRRNMHFPIARVACPSMEPRPLCSRVSWPPRPRRVGEGEEDVCSVAPIPGSRPRLKREKR